MCSEQCTTRVYTVNGVPIEGPQLGVYQSQAPARVCFAEHVYGGVSAHQLPSAASANALHWASLAKPKHLGVQGPRLHIMLAHNARQL